MPEVLLNLDGNILLWIQENVRNEYLTPVFKFITRLGDRGMIWIVLSLLLVVFRVTRKTGVLVALSLLMSLLVNNVILKNLVQRIRPYEVVQGLTHLIEKQRDYSFPSAHTGASFAVATIIYCEMPKKYGIPAMILAGLIAVSRLYLGVHYPSDVLCGALTGTALALLVRTCYDRRIKTSEK